ncbi:hypothetical protein F5Y14DRAFT_397209 [Nemania sp. NC0429]|nr:hypothetical protein F5Y14DRAFT_397209 [Nemania sp. NC0429]
MNIPSTPGEVTLPSVEAERVPTTTRPPPRQHPYSILEALRYFAGTDENLIWGPYYERFRAAQKERTGWRPWSLGAIWDGIPAASQTRPGRLAQYYNWFTGRDPAPTLTVTPLRMRAAVDDQANAGPTTPRAFDFWQQAVSMDDRSPSQIDFSQWYGREKHPVDYDDDFYTANYRALYERLCDFCETWFGGDVYLQDYRDYDGDDDSFSPWEVPMTEQFLQYARMVAHEDAGYVDWKDILNDPAHRKWLCVGIFSQIIERKIFNQLLFGAGPTIQAELDRQDESWVLSEGFIRKEGRRQIARLSLQRGLVPDNFWNEVDDLAGQTVLVFQPLFMLMALSNRRTVSQDGPVFWQEVHTILAMAGYFQVCMTVSPSIFHVLSASPGARFQWGEETHADQRIYDDSKAFHGSHNARWGVLARLSLDNNNNNNNDTNDTNDRDRDRVNRLSDVAADYAPLPLSDGEYRAIDHQRRRGGKVMYAVFPKLTRYTAENVGEIYDDGEMPATWGALREEGEGMRIRILSRCMVVYYQGLVHSPADQTDGAPLDDHLDKIERSRMAGGVLPFFKHHWDVDGTAARSLRWPLWPETVDIFWLYWLLSLAVTSVLRRAYGPPPPVEQRGLWATLLFRPLAYHFFEAVLYLALRVPGLSLFQGRYAWWQMQGLVMASDWIMVLLEPWRGGKFQFFSYLAALLIWLDQVIVDTVPRLVEALSGVLRNGAVGSLVDRTAAVFTAVNGTAGN